MSDKEINLKEVEALLLKAGLDDDEVKVFLATLQLGGKPASLIAKKAAVGRSQTYQILRDLSQRGLVLEVTRNGVSQFTACSAEDFTSKLSHQIEEMRGVLSQLSTILPLIAGSGTQAITKVEFWRGDQALMNLWEKFLQYPKTAISGFLDYELRWPSHRGPEAEKWDHEYSLRRAANGIKMRVICNRSHGSDEVWKSRKKYAREMKIIEDFNIPIAILIHSTAVMITCNTTQVFGVVIRDEEVSKGFQHIFDAAWDKLPDYYL